MSRYEALPPDIRLLSRTQDTVDWVPEDEIFKENFNPVPPLPWRSSAATKLQLIASSIVPLLASFALLLSNIRERSSTGMLLSFVVNNRATTQIVVSIISASLAALNIYTAIKMLNFSTRIHLLRRPLSLAAIEFVRAVSTRTILANLPFLMSTTTMFMVIILALPNIIWTGALTPILTNVTMTERDVLKIPAYSNNTRQIWAENHMRATECSTAIKRKGTFSDCLLKVIQSSMIHGAAQASSNLTHPKLDNSRFSFIGRSYGVGASVGVVDDDLFIGNSTSKLQSFNYTEPGYFTNVNCIYNASTDFHLEPTGECKLEWGIPCTFFAMGIFPNAPPGSKPDFFSVVGIGGSQNIAVVAAKRYQGRNVILMTAGPTYDILSNVQCEVVMTLTYFNVDVDVTNKLITVSPQSDSLHDTNDAHFPGMPVFDPDFGLAGKAMDQVNGLGMVSTTAYISVLGDAIITNLQANIDNSPFPPADAGLSSMADSFASMIDDVLLFIGGSQFFVSSINRTRIEDPRLLGEDGGDFTRATASITVQAVRMGELKYTIAIFTINLALCVLLTFEATRTRFWAPLPNWDFMDTRCLVQASAVAGPDILREMSKHHGRVRNVDLKDGGADMGTQWTGTDDGCTHEKGFEVRLGWKTAWARATGEGQQGDNDREDGRGPRDLQITAVSLWTRDGAGVEPLVQ